MAARRLELELAYFVSLASVVAASGLIYLAHLPVLQLPTWMTIALVACVVLAGVWWALPGQRSVAYTPFELAAFSVLGACMLLIAASGPSWSPQATGEGTGSFGSLLGPIVLLVGSGYSRVATILFDGLALAASGSLLALVGAYRFRSGPSPTEGGTRALASRSVHSALILALFVLCCSQSVMGGALTEWSGIFLSVSDFALRLPTQFLALAAAAAVATLSTNRWLSESSNRTVAPLKGSSYDRLLAVVVLVAALGQAILGLAQRSTDGVLVFHALIGGAVLPPLFLHLAVRGWLVYTEGPARNLSLLLGGLVSLQVALGLLALLVPGTVHLGAATGLIDLTLISLHQWGAMALVGCSSALVCWQFRR